MKKFFLVIMLVLFAVSLFSVDTPSMVENPDKPSKGEWDLKLKKDWLVKNAGEALIGGIIKIVVNEAGSMFVHDEKNLKFFIFDKDGKFIKGFGIEGEGPGDIKQLRHAKTFDVMGKLVIVDVTKVSYFSYDGIFIDSVKNDFFRRQPHLFIDENTFVSAPIGLLEVPADDPTGKILVVNLKANTEKEISKFKVYAGGEATDKGRQRVIVMPGLTPVMIFGYYNQKVYYGRNDSYVINVADLNGKTVLIFSVEKRQKKRMTDEAKIALFEHHDWESRVKKEIAESLPDELTYFNHIKIHNDLIYVFEAHVVSVDSIQIDIFSLDGKYLYKTRVTPGKGLKIIPAAEGIVIHNDKMYIAIEDENGDQMIAKYTISLPKG